MREANIDDLDAVKDLAVEFINLTGYVAKDIELLVSKCFMDGFILVCESEEGKVVGFLAGFYADIALMGGKVFNEAAWFVTKDCRGGGQKLFKLMEVMCKRDNAVGIMMAAYNNEHINAVERLYARSGYSDIEHHWLKRLEK